MQRQEICADERDFFTAFHSTKSYAFTFDDGSIKAANGALAIVAYFLQGALIAMAFAILFNLSRHQYYLGLAGGRDGWADANVIVRLKASDPIREFGLGEWNRTMNGSYLFIAVSMLIPLISHAVQPQSIGLEDLGPIFQSQELLDELCPVTDCSVRDVLQKLGRKVEFHPPDIGQFLLQVLLPLLFLVPLGFALSSRQALINKAKHDLSEAADKMEDAKDRVALEEQFHAQTLWPFDRDLVGKAAFAIVIIEYAFVASNAPTLIQAILKGHEIAGQLPGG